ncbi:ornithine cyclodeaminase family protein [Pleomorphomonas sp. JP5]|uniref:ornithine cyclodeaminase family protein n=1 Tax=Pleomorphomonas sp. JP5 TaxID=2942998 RepID=UPI002042D4FA|nr:ornithine cyclodeaminase family protein [Pleomorphomonas sp. JP5]MCM5556824.1 ornithine cyclodeaminase family protein [Pleomorphomonas sp. JP5]
MLVLDAAATAAALDYPALIAGLREIFAAGVTAPLRHAHGLPRVGEPDATLLVMPAWMGDGSHGGVKIVNVVPGNAKRGLPAVTASYLLFDETTGSHVALMDGATLTGRRTAAASALAASYLARADARTLLVVGAGHIGSEMPGAYRAVRPIERVLVWNPTPERAERLVTRLRGQGIEADTCDDLEAAVGEADIISCATLSRSPLIHGDWLKPGQHLDLVGSFTPEMREADDRAVARGRVFVDGPAAAVESGDIKGPMASGALKEIAGTLYDLCGGGVEGRRSASEITLFKSVGLAVEDLAAARVALASRRPD